MRRRDALQRAGLGVAAIAAGNLLSGGKALAAGKRGFRLLAVAALGPHRVAMFGNGQFDGSDADGGGSFTHFLVDASGMATTVAGTGEWKAKRTTAFTEGPVLGGILSGVLDLDIEFLPKAGGSFPASLRVVCNVGLPGGNTGQTEGIVLTAGGTAFKQGAGLTALVPAS